ncbi:MAG: biosynthetic peptidoglycan transglycosylase [Streptosporangiaceae bacterium]
MTLVARRIVLLCAAALLTFVVAFGSLLLLTPSVGNARQLASAFDRAHHADYPGVVVPYRFAKSLEATEDHRFSSEPGVDPLAVGRVLYSFATGHGDQGGATLYQQLAKMLYTPAQTGVVAEAEQVALAVKLKFSYSGAEVLRLYTDVAYFGHGFYGLAAASCGYFGVRPAQMSWPQAALLAGLVQAPTVDDPLTYPAHGLARERHVIGRLVAVGALTQPQANRYLAIPLHRLLAGAGGCRS